VSRTVGAEDELLGLGLHARRGMANTDACGCGDDLVRGVGQRSECRCFCFPRCERADAAKRDETNAPGRIVKADDGFGRIIFFADLR